MLAVEIDLSSPHPGDGACIVIPHVYHRSSLGLCCSTPRSVIPIVVLTRIGAIRTRADAMKEGAVHFLTKQIDCVRWSAVVG
jgi:hypothetical protein